MKLKINSILRALTAVALCVGPASSVVAGKSLIRLNGPDGGLVAAGSETPWTYVDSPGGFGVVSENEDAKKPVYLYLNIEEPGFADGNTPIIEFSYEYFDESEEEVMFAYDSNDPFYGTLEQPGVWKGGGGFQLMDSKTWKKKTIVLDDARFSNRINGQDIRFRLVNHNRLQLRNISIKALERVPDLPPPPRTRKDSPNVLMVVFDDLNDYVGAFGDPNAKTPNLDDFAKSAMRFEKAYCQYPVCGPSRASFLTGLYPETTGVLDNETHVRPRRPDAVNMLELFKNNGYWTATAGKIFHGHTNVAERDQSTYASDWFQNKVDIWQRELERRFEREVGPKKGNEAACQAYVKEHYVSPQRVVRAVATDLDDDDHKDGLTTRRICSYLEEKPFGERPFFMACGIAKPHVPHFSPKKYFDRYPIDEIRFEDVPEDDWANKPKNAAYSKYKGYGEALEIGVNNRAIRGKWLQAYLANVSHADAMFGRVIDALEKNGLADNTIVVLFGDHGYHIGEHFMYGKTTLFEESARVPFVMRVPGKTDAASSSDSFAELLDIYPTLTELCGIETPEHLQGKSLVPVLENPEKAVRDSVYTVVTRGSMVARSVRHNNWRYAEWGSSEQAELYDLEKDPDEYSNLAGNPEYAQVVARLSGMIAEKRKKITFSP